MHIRDGHFFYFHHFHKVVRLFFNKTIAFATKFEREILRMKDLCVHMTLHIKLCAEENSSILLDSQEMHLEIVSQ